jgi:transcriptional regulator with XRE-family HTH domain
MKMGLASQSFGHRLKQMRTGKKMTLEEMGKILGTSKQVLSRYENGRRVPKITTAKLYAERLGVDLRYLLGESEQPQSSRADNWAPQEVRLVSGNGDQRIYHLEPKVAAWFCDLLDHPEKLNQALDAAAK